MQWCRQWLQAIRESCGQLCSNESFNDHVRHFNNVL